MQAAYGNEYSERQGEKQQGRPQDERNCPFQGGSVGQEESCRQAEGSDNLEGQSPAVVYRQAEQFRNGQPCPRREQEVKKREVE